MKRKPHAVWREEVSLALCEADSIEIGGRRLVPDACMGYVEFRLAHAFPTVLKDPYRSALHPQVVANSWRTMQDKMLNYAHQMQAYDPKLKEDHIIGAVVEVEFPETPAEGWTVTENPPGIRAAASIFKAAQDSIRIMELHLFDRPWAVSMECFFGKGPGNGFLVQGPRRGTDTIKSFASDDLKAVGLEYVAWEDAPADLKAAWDMEQAMWVKDWRGQKPVFMMGGLNGSVQFGGVAMCPVGKEAEAEVVKLLAADDRGAGVAGPLQHGLEMLRALR